VTEKRPSGSSGDIFGLRHGRRAPFNREALIAALRTDQAGNSTFPEFLMASWQAGVVKYEVDLIERTCTYYGINDKKYVESYPEVKILVVLQGTKLNVAARLRSV
jgi:uncharacterized protein YbcV (DUF1398 family)